MRFSYLDYLDAKRTVDDRALNQQVWQTMVAHWKKCPSPRHLLEIGCGAGAMLERFADGNLLADTSYLGIDNNVVLINTAQQRMPASPTTTTRYETISLTDFLAQETGQTKWDMVLAHAVLDLLPVPKILPALFQQIRSGGYFYFTINFDGETIFQPTIDPDLDRQIITLYHQTMDKRVIHNDLAGDSRTGRHLFDNLQRAGGEILNAGSSDWIVYPQNGTYIGEEKQFLHYIIHTLSTALAQHPQLNQQQFTSWVATRQCQIEHGELIYIAHQLDFFGARK